MPGIQITHSREQPRGGLQHAPSGRASALILGGLLVAVYAVAIVFRAPALLTAPRFWAEEGALYFAGALATPWWISLTTPRQGYYSLVPSLSALGAALLPLPLAPAATTAAALAVQLVPAALIAWSRGPLWDSWARRGAALAIVLFVSATGEIWLNTINSQVHLTMATALVLISDPPVNRAGKWATRAVLGLAGLTGPASTFLVPVYVALAWMDRGNPRGRERAVHAGLLAGCLLIQMSALAWTIAAGRLGNRFNPGSAFPPVREFLVQCIAAPFFPLPSSRAAIVAGGALALLAMADDDFRRRWVFFSASALLGTLSFVFSLRMQGGPRYAYVPGALLVIYALGCIRGGSGPRRHVLRSVAAVLVLCALFTWAPRYRDGMRFYAQPDWPAWGTEVGNICQHPRIAIWPQWPQVPGGRWSLVVPETARPGCVSEGMEE